MATLGASAWAQDEGFQAWREALAQEAVSVGISPVTVSRALDGVEPDEDVVELDQKQPEGSIGFATYYKNVATAARLKKGSALLHEHAETLREASARHGVPAGVIVALWGIESGFGRNMGSFSVVRSLITLAYEGRRATFFRNELIEALRIIDEEQLEPNALMGSWAGAMGQCQFMPSTFRRYAVDADGDGRRDIWDSTDDVIGSIARYLAAEGWKAGQGWGREVKLTRPLPSDVFGLEIQKPVSTWARMGVVNNSKKPLPSSNLQASLIKPDGGGGRAFLVYDNFRAVMRWNRSTYFALTVGLMADRLGSPTR